MNDDFKIDATKLITHMLHDVTGTMTLSALSERFRHDLDSMIDALKALHAEGKIEFEEVMGGRTGVRWTQPNKPAIPTRHTPSRKANLPQEILDKARELKRQKWGCSRIAHHLRVAPTTLYYAMKGEA